MQPSKLRRSLVLIVLSACGGLDPRRLGPPEANEAEAGIAGFSFDAGVAASGGNGGRLTKPTEDWEPVGNGGGGDEPAGSAGFSHEGSDDPDNEGGAGGESPTFAGLGGGSGEPGGGGSALGGALPTGGLGSSGEPGLGGQGGRSAGGGRAGVSSGGRTSVSSGGRGSGGGRAASGGVGSSAGGGGATSDAGSAGSAGSAGIAGSAGTSSAAPAPMLGELVFSEYVEGSASYKALELYAARAVSLSGCALATYYNGSSSPSRLALEGELAAGAVTVLCSPSLATLLGAVCGRSTSLSFNGNDAVALECGGVTLDAIGVAGFDPGTGWSGGDASTLNQTLRRRCDAGPDASLSDAFEPSLEWLALPADTFDGLGDPTCG
jgi:hypothetical protein